MTKAMMNTSSTPRAPPQQREDAAHLLRTFVKWLRQHPEVEVSARFGRPASASKLKGARVPRDLANFYAEMNGAEIRWRLRGSAPDDPDAGGALCVPTLDHNLKGWSRSDFFTEDPDKPSQFRVPDEVPLLRRYYCRALWSEGYKAETLMELWEIGGDTATDVGLTGVDDYLERGIERLFVSEWTSLLSDFESPDVEERLARIYKRLGLSEGWFKQVLRQGAQRG